MEKGEGKNENNEEATTSHKHAKTSVYGHMKLKKIAAENQEWWRDIIK